VTDARHTAIADRKALLMAHAELDRSKVTLAILEVKSIVSPELPQERLARVRPTVSMILGFAAPLLGSSRLMRLLRFTSIALMALRIARKW
jgi:hypothetical protein